MSNYSHSEPRNGLGLTALILGLGGLVFGLVPLTGFIALIVGIAGVALGLAGVGRLRRSRATNGKTTWIGVVVSTLAIVMGIWGMTITFNAVDQFDQDMSEIDEQFDKDMKELDRQLDADLKELEG